MAEPRVYEKLVGTAEFHLRLTSAQHEQLRKHLFPGDGKEAVALALCGRRAGSDNHILTVRQIIEVPHQSCSVRTPTRVNWPTNAIESLLMANHGRRQAIVKIHSHPGGFPRFSETDDTSDLEILNSVIS